MNDLTKNIRSAARRGDVDLTEVRTASDIHIARRFCPIFRESTRNIGDDAILMAIETVLRDGERKFRSGVGLWLTDREMGR